MSQTTFIHTFTNKEPSLPDYPELMVKTGGFAFQPILSANRVTDQRNDLGGTKPEEAGSSALDSSLQASLLVPALGGGCVLQHVHMQRPRWNTRSTASCLQSGCF